jgi:hypothetical protein
LIRIIKNISEKNDNFCDPFEELVILELGFSDILGTDLGGINLIANLNKMCPAAQSLARLHHT